MKTFRYRSVFVSDWHIGAKNFDSAAALRFLRSIECDMIYLAGDIIDGWKLKKRWHWDDNCTLIIDELLHKHDQGTKIIYIPGNHDEDIRPLLPFLKIKLHKLHNFVMTDQTVHKTAKGKKFLVLHGDQFDHKILRGAISRWSDFFYDWFLETFGRYDRPTIRVNGEEKRFSLAKFLKKPGQKALTVLNNFETLVQKAVHRHHCDGLICGHTHIPALKTIKDVMYANPGDWIRTGHTAIVENDCGTLELLDWPCSQIEPELFLFPEQPRQPHARTEMIMQFIQTLWHPQKAYTRKSKQARADFIASTLRISLYKKNTLKASQ